MPTVGSIFDNKEKLVTATPLLLVSIQFPDPSFDPLFLCTHELVDDTGHTYPVYDKVTKTFITRNAPRSFAWTAPVTSGPYVAGTKYEFDPRILNQDMAATQALSEDGIDITPTVTLRIADPDGFIWYNYEYNDQAPGFKGAIMTLTMIMWNMVATDSTGQRVPDFSTDVIGTFIGQCNPLLLSDDSEVTLSAVSKLNMKRVMLPKVQIQKRCPWIFPGVKNPDGSANVAASQARQATANDFDSPYYFCGYQDPAYFPGSTSNTGFVDCDFLFTSCIARGQAKLITGQDILHHSIQVNSGNFGGISFDLAAANMMDWHGTEYVSATKAQGVNNPNLAKYGQYVPMAYGTTWVDGVIMTVMGDPNTTRGEVLITMGEVGDIINVVVNDTNTSPAQIRNPQTGLLPVSITNASNSTPITIITSSPHGLSTGALVYISGVASDGVHGNNNTNGVYSVVVDGPTTLTLVGSTGNQNYTGGGTVSANIPANGTIDVLRWNIINWGVRTGIANQDAPYNGKGDPYGNLAAIEWVVPAAVTASNSTPHVRVLIEGPKLPAFSADPIDGAIAVTGGGGKVYYQQQVGYPFNENPIWQMLDVLTKCGWSYKDMDLDTFITEAAYCDEMIDYIDQFGRDSQHQRFACSWALTQRTPASDILRSLRQSCHALLLPNNNGLLAVKIKKQIAKNQPNPIIGSNNQAETVNGGYLAYDFDESNIKRADNGKSTFRVNQLQIQQAPNKIKVAFQDKDNAYQQDALAIIDDFDYNNVGEVDTLLQITGPNSFDHCQRIITTYLAELLKGNPSAISRGTMQFNFESSVNSCHLHVGDIIRINFPDKGVTDVLARIMSIQPDTNFRGAKIMAQWHDDYWYDDLYGQGREQGRGAGGGLEQRPPYPWQPDYLQPFAGDPVYSQTEYNFAIQQEYQEQTDNSQQAFVTVTGYQPMNAISTSGLRPPNVSFKGKYSDSGGNYPGPNVFWVALCAKDSDGSLTKPSFFVKIDVTTGGASNSLIVDRIAWDTGSSGCSVFAGTDPNSLTWQGDFGNSSTITLTDYKVRTRGLPDQKTASLLMQAKYVRHTGVFGAGITAVGAGTLTIAGADWTTDEWAGRICAVVDTDSLGTQVPIWNFRITGNTTDTLSVTPNPLTTSPPVAVGSALIMRILVDENLSTATKIVDLKFINSLNGFGEPFEISNVVDNGDGTIEVYTTDPHLLDGTKKIAILGVLGADGIDGSYDTSAYVVDSPTTVKVTSSISSPYNSGGTLQSQIQGMVPGDEIGETVRILAGTGRGQIRTVIDNDQTSITVNKAFIPPLDNSSIVCIEESAWEHQIQSSPFSCSLPGVEISVVLPVHNLEGDTILVQGLTLDANGNPGFDYLAPVREVYLIGAPGATFIRDWLCKGIIADDPMAVGTDVMANHYRVRVNPGEWVELVDTAIQAKDAPTGSDAIFDVLVSTDNGGTWSTIFTSTIHLQAGHTGANFADTRFTVKKLYRDHLLRFDIVQVGSSNAGGGIEIDIKGKVFR